TPTVTPTPPPTFTLTPSPVQTYHTATPEGNTPTATPTVTPTRTFTATPLADSRIKIQMIEWPTPGAQGTPGVACALVLRADNLLPMCLSDDSIDATLINEADDYAWTGEQDMSGAVLLLPQHASECGFAVLEGWPCWDTDD